MMYDPLPMIIDSFAGGGGASTGIELALGRSPDVAINHNAAALALHAANHPKTLHLDSNIWDVDPRSVTKGRKVGLLWASPDCKHFSKAKGGAPRDRNIRDLAWVVVKWAEDVKPDVIAMENVEEFLTWGPVDNDGQPIKEFAGQTFDDWKHRLRRAGYKVQHRELRACDYGAPTIRKRFFLIARRDGLPIVWPKPTHGDPRSAEVKRGKLLPWRTAAECIDWSVACPSIFDSQPEIMAKHGLRAVRPLADNTLARIARGMKRYVIEAESPFLVEIGYGERPRQAPRVQDIAAPLATVVAGSVKHALIAPALATFYGHTDGRGVRSADLAEPLRTVTTENRHALIAPVLTYAQQGGGNRSITAPHHTICASSKDQNCLITPHLLSLKGTARRAMAIDAPHPTVLAGGGHSAIIAPHLMTMRNAQKPFNGADEPTHTITAGGAGLSTVVASIVGCGGRAGQSRPRGLDEPSATITAKADACIASAFLAQHNGGPRMGENAGRDARAPMSTMTATGAQQMPVAAFIARHFGQSVGHGADEPCGTTTASGGGKSAAVAAYFAKYYGTGDGSRTDDPCHTVTVKDRFAHVQADLQAPPFEAHHEARARAVADFLRAHGAWDGGEFVTLTIQGATFVVVDIGMRMLTPRELFNAQGFPPDYVIEGTWTEHDGDWHWKPFPKDVQVSCCGNSVCPDLARALIAANCSHLIQREMAA